HQRPGDRRGRGDVASNVAHLPPPSLTRRRGRDLAPVGGQVDRDAARYVLLDRRRARQPALPHVDPIAALRPPPIPRDRADAIVSFGQTFLSPSISPFLESIDTGLLLGAGVPDLIFSIFLLNGFAPVGPAVFQQSAGSSPAPFQHLSINT